MRSLNTYMHQSIKAPLLLMLLLCGAFSLNAQDAAFEAVVNKNPVGQNESFQYSLVLRNMNGRIQQPDFSGFQVLGGPNQDRSVRIFNGKRVSEFTVTWILAAKEPGIVMIDPAVATVNGKKVKSNSIKLEVKKGTSFPNKSQANTDLMVGIEVSQSTAYVGEQITVVYKLYSRYPDLQFQELEYPSSDGFWTETVEEEVLNWDPRYANINGVQYRQATMKTEVLYPQRAGEFSIDPVKLEAVGKRGFFDNYRKLIASCEGVKIKVKPLPESPGGVELGTFDQLGMKVSTDRTAVPANEAVTLSIKFSGKGNLKLLDSPEINFPPDLEVFEPKRVDKINVGKAGISGSRSFEYVIIPRTEGTYTIPALQMSYFDPGSKSYKSLNSEEIVLNVSKGTGENSSYTYNSKTDVSILNTDIRFIITDASAIKAVDDRFFGSAVYYGLTLAPILAFGLFLFRKRREQSISENPEEWRMKQAGKVAKKHLSEARKELGKGDSKAFYGTLLQAIQGYLTSKFGIQLSELNERTLKEKLGPSLTEELSSELNELIRDAEMARFAGLGNTSEQDMLNRAEALISKIEKNVK